MEDHLELAIKKTKEFILLFEEFREFLKLREKILNKSRLGRRSPYRYPGINKDTFMSRIKKISKEFSFYNSFVINYYKLKPNLEIDYLISKIIKLTEDSFNNESIIIESIKIIEKITILLHGDLGRLEATPISKPQTTDDLTTFLGDIDSLKLSNEWAISALYLSAMEIAVNKKLEELNESLNKKKESFENRFKRLCKVIKTKEKREIEEGVLTSAFYKARNKVLHEGKKPTTPELKIIKSHVVNLISELFKK